MAVVPVKRGMAMSDFIADFTFTREPPEPPPVDSNYVLRLSTVPFADRPGKFTEPIGYRPISLDNDFYQSGATATFTFIGLSEMIYGYCVTIQASDRRMIMLYGNLANPVMPTNGDILELTLQWR